MKTQPIIGLEIHLQLNTQSKVFCGCSAQTWEAEPNTHTCPVCLGLPGAIPVLNKTALEFALKMALALDCSISSYSEPRSAGPRIPCEKVTYFERKNYFYPDLPKGFQISQKRAPLGKSGKVKTPEGEFGIWEVHLEEDTAKSTHTPSGTLLDFNKSGLPLLEIVSAPDMHSVEELNSFAKEIREIALALGISNCDMEKGEMRFEANISVMKNQPRETSGVGSSETPEVEELAGRAKLPSYRVEIKNLNSFKYLRDAVAYEIERQTKLIEKGEQPAQETRGWDLEEGKTYIQRTKEEAHDYRYFPEPDLPPIQLVSESASQGVSLEKIKKELPELPGEKRERYKKMGLSDSQADILARDSKREEYFQKAIKNKELKEVLEKGKDVTVKPEVLIARFVINEPEILSTTPSDLAKKIEKERAQSISNEEKIEEIAKEVIKENPKPVQDYKDGKEEAVQFLLGKVMQKTQGNADPQISTKILKKKLAQQ